MRNVKFVKGILAGVLAFAVAIAGIVCVPDEAQAEGNSALQWQEVTNKDFTDKIAKHEAPVYEGNTENTGYLFAGWYDAENGNPIETADGVETDVYAKFIPASLTGIACQVDLNADENKRNMRVVSLIDSDQYDAVGFNIYGRYDKDNDGSNETEWVMYKYGETNSAQSTSTFKGLYQFVDPDGDGKFDKQEKYPKDVFGAAAEGFFFTTVSITGIPADFYDATMAVQPYWVTLDGTYVEGMGEFNRISDYGEDTVVRNISVNIKDATDIAAGLLEIAIPQEFAEYEIEVENGRVFSQFSDYVDEANNIIRCIGNVTDIKTHAAEPNSVFVNIRITTPKTSNIALGQNTFDVSIPSIGGFSTNKEKVAKVSVWDVIY